MTPTQSFCVYRHTAPNGKVYIGITGQDPLRQSNRGKRSKPVYCAELERVFYSMDAAEQELGVAHENIAKVCLGKRQTAGGYHWEYYNAG